MNASLIPLNEGCAWRTYLGGKCIRQLHGVANAQDDHFPEEWLMSVVTARNPGREAICEGLSRTADGDSLKARIEADPEGMLGRAFAARFGATPGVLVKLLDAAERLTIQVHPTAEQAQRLFHSPFGKTECWHILGTRPMDGAEACIYFGFRPGVTRARWRDCFDRQDIPAMLDCLHRFPVRPGDTWLIEGGIPHAIGAGCFLAEIQEPTDYTIRTERVTPSGLAVADESCHQGLGFDRMFDCFDYSGRSEEETRARSFIVPKTTEQPGGVLSELVGYDRTRCFRMMQYEVTREMTVPSDGLFCGLYVLSGAGCIGDFTVHPGSSFFVPASHASFVLRNTGSAPLRVLRCFGPKPEGPDHTN